MATNAKNSIYLESAWEVCNKVGGIYTVIRTKAKTMVANFGDDYYLVGPYIHKDVEVEFEELELPDSPIGKTIAKLEEQGLKIHYGRWLIPGRPQAILLDPNSVKVYLEKIKYYLWDHHKISVPSNDKLIDDVLAFGHMQKMLFGELSWLYGGTHNITIHLHEWMAASCVPEMKKEKQKSKVVFTTHATILGRYLAMNKSFYYKRLHTFHWKSEARHFDIEFQASIERKAAQCSDVMTTVSEVTAKECEAFLGRTPDHILPNGLNIEHFSMMHQLQTKHLECKENIHKFTIGHFFPSYSFDLEETIYFFTSGRYEFKNKGFDLTLDALNVLNRKLQESGSNTTVVTFFITKRPTNFINPRVLHSRAVLDKVKTVCETIEKQIGDKLFFEAATSPEKKMPDLNEFVDDYWKLRLRRTLQSWKSEELPLISTHSLKDFEGDDIIQRLRKLNLVNNAHDRVKVVYHPDFISPVSPINQQEYDDFVRGCHMGIFPSYYEPWGYTPLECIALGVPTVTSNLSGFGDYALKNIDDLEKYGIDIVNRTSQSYDQTVQELAEKLFQFIQLPQTERMERRRSIENNSQAFDWSNLVKHYKEAYEH